MKIIFAILLFMSVAHAGTNFDETAEVNITGPFKGLQTIEITCKGQVYSTTVPEKELASSIKRLEAWVEDKCQSGSEK